MQQKAHGCAIGRRQVQEELPLCDCWFGACIHPCDLGGLTDGTACSTRPGWSRKRREWQQHRLDYCAFRKRICITTTSPSCMPCMTMALSFPSSLYETIENLQKQTMFWVRRDMCGFMREMLSSDCSAVAFAGLPWDTQTQHVFLGMVDHNPTTPQDIAHICTSNLL